MNSQTYIANAIKTESVPARVDMNQIALMASLQLMIATARLADLVKRKVFYGKAIDNSEYAQIAQRIEYFAGFSGHLATSNLVNQEELKEISEADLPEGFAGVKLDNISPRLFHAAIGCFTESGELIEAIEKQFKSGEIDLVNFGEEIGDLEWYQAIGFDATGVSEESCREKNIAKLKARYPNKFDANLAINRDTVAERAILEGADKAPA